MTPEVHHVLKAITSSTMLHCDVKEHSWITAPLMHVQLVVKFQIKAWVSIAALVV